MINPKALPTRVFLFVGMVCSHLASLSLDVCCDSIIGSNSAAPHFACAISSLCSRTLTAVLVQRGERDSIATSRYSGSDHNYYSHGVVAQADTLALLGTRCERV